MANFKVAGLLFTGRHFWNRKCRKKTWWQQKFAVFKCEATANSVTGHVCVYNNESVTVYETLDGKMCIRDSLILVTDDEDRENEGDLICAASFATTENVNFMATHAKGLICMPMSAEICRKLQFPQMVMDNTDNHETAFTVSIDHKTTTTGISAEERGITARACVDPDTKPEDFRRPGHMFPLMAKKNGILERNGHTEATVCLLYTSRCV